MAPTLTRLLGLITRIQKTACNKYSAGTPADSDSMLALIEELRLAVETPTDTILRLIYQPPQNAALRTVVELGVFSRLNQGSGGLSATALTESTGADKELIVRLMRVITALGLCTSVEPEIYYPNARTRQMAEPIGQDGLVDIGGNKGHDLERFQARYPDAPGQLVLQDLPSVLPSAIDDGIKQMAYSFWDPQPVRGARAYYFRSIFHDWPDHVCLQILRNTISAMDAEYSRILIVDFVLPDTNVPLLQASLDIQMMSIGAGVERSEGQWRSLLRDAGLDIRNIWSTNPAREAVIEAGLRLRPGTRNSDAGVSTA
ncbi:hypothetical protein FE257_002196 [Aspergillus nanangensis]|uniref:O-methyltransferase domain-containing protein n=1 Tax=Aspergillus nanangensis TaxID=2582783 RepID=A0AAD4CCZ1_ASPNN|nr:hypothetical protein FE257_002196 [Aspergillus nanangensis]